MVKRAEWYMEHQTTYWYIKVQGTSTVVQAGTIGCAGRTYPSVDHKKKAAAELAAKCQVKQKEKKGYTLKSTPPPSIKASTGPGKSTSSKPYNPDRKKTTPTPKPPTPKKNASRGGRSTKPKTGKRSTPTSSQIVEAPANKKTAQGKNQTSNTPARQTQGEDEIYIPPKEQWPVEITVPEVMSMCRGDLGYGIFADDTRCLVGFDNGWVYELSLSGTLVCKYKLHDGVQCITKDGDFVYVGCNDGGLYDLTRKEPRLMCMIKGFGQVCVLHIHQGLIAAGDDRGSVALVNYEGETMWKKSLDPSCTWLARLDNDAVYHGNGHMVHAYRCTDGKQMWKFKTNDDISYGELDEDHVYACTPTDVYKLNKKTGTLIQHYKSNNLDGIACIGVDDYGMVLAGGVYGGSLAVVCFDGESGDIVYILKNSLRAMTLQYHKGRVYNVGQSGFVCIDLTENAIKEALKGNKKPVSKEIKMDASAPTHAPLEAFESVNMSDVTDGVVVHCVKEGGKLRIKPESDGYNSDWNCQFPRDLRTEGARYVVDELRKVSGQFYRVFGNIRQLQE